MFEYLVLTRQLVGNASVFFAGSGENVLDDVNEELNSLGREGWELTAVVPITNGGSPAQIQHAVHYLRRRIDSPANAID